MSRSNKQLLVRVDRVRTGYGIFKYNMNLKGLSPSASCECGAASQTAHHLESESTLHRCCGDLVTLNTNARNGFATCCVLHRRILHQTQEKKEEKEKEEEKEEDKNNLK